MFYSKSNANIDKGGLEVFGFTDDYPDAQCVEFCNNVSDACLFHAEIPDDWSEDFEFRQPDEYGDISDFKVVHDWTVSTWQGGATGDALNESYTGVDGTVYNNDTAEYRLAKFKKEFTEYYNLDFCLVYYVLTTCLMMVDQRAKNMFLTTWDKVHWEPWLYDNDTCLGINNEGKLVFSPFLEDDDQVDGANVYNGATSTLWVNFRESFPEEIQELYSSWRSDGLMSYEKVIEYFITRQTDMYSISVYNEDSDEKYIKDLREKNDGTYLYQIRGTGEEHLKYFIKSRLDYLDSKWCCGSYPSDYISLRIYTPMDENNNPITNLPVAANPDITVTPYVNTYAGVQFGAGSDIAQHKAEQNVPITLEWTMNGSPNDLETSVFPASQISSLGDLSPLYCGTVNVSKATKLTELIVGNGTSGYANNNLTELAVGANNLLQKVDVRNCQNLTEPLALANCPNIQEIYATGSGITGLELPSSGYLKKVYLPGTLTNLTVTNQQYIEEFTLEGYDNLTTLRIEDTVNIPVEDIMLNAPNLNRIRLIDVQWEAESEEALVQTIEKFKTCLGLDANGNNTDTAVVTGRVKVNENVSDEVVGDIYNSFPDLVVDDGSEELYIVNYKDWDGSILYSMRLAEGDDAIDPIATGAISAPFRASDENYSYEFVGWSTLPTNVSRHYQVTAQYKTLVAVNFAVDGDIIHSEYVQYGSGAEDPVANGTIEAPTKEGTDDLRYVFDGWDGSLLNITIPRTINAVFCNVYPVRFYATDSSATPHYVQWVKDGSDAYDPVAAGDCAAPADIVTENEKKLVFSAWDSIPAAVTAICQVYAQYNTHWAARFWNESTLHCVEYVLDGSDVSEPTVDTPVKESTAQYYYTFSSWDGDFAAISEARDYYAVYTSTVRRYNVYFYNGDELIQTVENIQYGSSATYTGSTPVKTGVDNPDEYVFKGWLPSPENITGETHCYALFKFTGYLFGKLSADSEYGTVDAPNWDKINAYWTIISNDVSTLTQEELEAKYMIGGRMIIPIELADGTSTVADVEIIGHNHDNLADGSGKASLTFFCIDLPNIERAMNEPGTDEGGWENSAMRTFVNGELFNVLPDELRTIIKPVSKISDGGPTNETLVTTTDSCWLASYDEVGFAAGRYNLAGQGELYSSIFSSNKNTRKKYIIDDTETGGWWLRSTYYTSSTSSMFWRVQKSGASYGDIQTGAFFVAFGFCI